MTSQRLLRPTYIVALSLGHFYRIQNFHGRIPILGLGSIFVKIFRLNIFNLENVIIFPISNMHILADFSTNPNSLQAKEVISYERSTCVANACMFVLFIVPEKRKPPVPEATKPPVKKKRLVGDTKKRKQQSKAPVDDGQPWFSTPQEAMAAAIAANPSNFEDPDKAMREWGTGGSTTATTPAAVATPPPPQPSQTNIKQQVSRHIIW